jgi:hypothetical protein
VPSIALDSMDSAAPWQALAPDGVTPSTELSLTVDTSRPRVGFDSSAGLVSATVNALNHTLRRSFPGLDLTNFDDLRLWINSERPADGTTELPFFLEVRLASAALALHDPANTWQRYLPVSQAGTWESIRLGIGDLPPAVRNAVTLMQLRCSDATTAFNCDVDDILAVRDGMVGDVDAALLALLNNVLVLNAHPAPAVLHPGNGTLIQARPYFEITQYDVNFMGERTSATRPRGDFTDRGYTLRPPSNAYELFYQFTAVADDRAAQAQMLEFLLRTLPPRGLLVVNGLPLPMDSVFVDPEDQIGGFRTDAIPLFYRISTRQEVGSSDVVRAARTVAVDGGVRSLTQMLARR